MWYSGITGMLLIHFFQLHTLKVTSLVALTNWEVVYRWCYSKFLRGCFNIIVRSEGAVGLSPWENGLEMPSFPELPLILLRGKLVSLGHQLIRFKLVEAEFEVIIGHTYFLFLLFNSCILQGTFFILTYILKWVPCFREGMSKRRDFVKWVSGCHVLMLDLAEHLLIVLIDLILFADLLTLVSFLYYAPYLVQLFLLFLLKISHIWLCGCSSHLFDTLDLFILYRFLYAFLICKLKTLWYTSLFQCPCERGAIMIHPLILYEIVVGTLRIIW